MHLKITRDLPIHQVHIYFAYPETIQNPSLLDAYECLLSSDEHTRLHRYHFAKHRHHYLIAHALLRTTLSYYDPREPAAWQFNHNEYGKPMLAPDQHPMPMLQFNLSHTDGLVACAIVQKQMVGIDVENMHSQVNAAELATRILSPVEQAAFAKVPAHQQTQRFLEYWTLKEAYIKARGMGLSLALDGFSWQFGPQGLTLDFSNKVPDNAKYWQGWLLAPSQQHRGAVLVQKQGLNPQWIYDLKIWETVPLQAERESTSKILRQLI